MPTIVRFVFAYVTSPTNQKNSIPVVLSASFPDSDETFVFPPEAQPISLHGELARVPIVNTVIRAMTKRGQQRSLKIELSEELSKIYVDDMGNIKFKDYFLHQEDLPTENVFHASAPTTIQPAPVTEKKRSLQSITKDMVIQKYTSKTQNAEAWLRTFNRECDRLEITENRRAEALRLFLEKSPLDWFNSQWTTTGLQHWGIWTNLFLEAFGDKGWNEAWYAINYMYRPGTPISDYCIRKNSLLTDAYPEMNEKCRIMIITVGIPREVRARIDKMTVNTLGKLLSEVAKWEYNNNNNRNYGRRTQESDSSKERKSDSNTKRKYKPCPHCEKKGFKEKFHPENICWHNPASPEYKGERYNDKTKNNPQNTSSNKNQEKPIRIANNTELQYLFNENIDSKN